MVRGRTDVVRDGEPEDDAAARAPRPDAPAREGPRLSLRRRPAAPARPCPHLMVPEGGFRYAQPERDHRCTATRPPEAVGADRQRRLCLTGDHRSCPAFEAAVSRRSLVLAEAGLSILALEARRARPVVRTAPLVLGDAHVPEPSAGVGLARPATVAVEPAEPLADPAWAVQRSGDGRTDRDAAPPTPRTAAPPDATGSAPGPGAITGTPGDVWATTGPRVPVAPPAVSSAAPGSSPAASSSAGEAIGASAEARPEPSAATTGAGIATDAAAGIAPVSRPPARPAAGPLTGRADSAGSDHRAGESRAGAAPARGAAGRAPAAAVARADMGSRARTRARGRSLRTAGTAGIALVALLAVVAFALARLPGAPAASATMPLASAIVAVSPVSSAVAAPSASAVATAPAATPTPTAATTRPSPTASAVATATPGTPATYRVRAGDTLIAIAARFGTTVEELQRINGIKDPRLLRIGQVLRIP